MRTADFLTPKSVQKSGKFVQSVRPKWRRRVRTTEFPNSYECSQVKRVYGEYLNNRGTCETRISLTVRSGQKSSSLWSAGAAK